jgi:hypothetical protein
MPEKKDYSYSKDMLYPLWFLWTLERRQRPHRL